MSGNHFWICLLAIGSALGASPAFAAPKKAAKRPDHRAAVVANPTINATVDMPSPAENPSSQLILSQGDLEPALPSLRTQFQAGVSSWFPHNLVLDSQIPASAFNGRGIPQVTFGLAAPLSDRPVLAGAVSGKFGLEFATLTRTGTLGVGAVSSLSTERLYWAGFKLGGEWSPTALQARAVRPYLGAALVPSLLLSGPSVFGRGLTVFALPVEGELGVEISLGKLPVLTIGLEGKWVSVRGNNVSALGAAAGMRFPL